MPVSVPEKKVRELHEFELEPGRTVALQELTCDEFEQVVRHVANSENKDWELASQGVRYSLVRDGTEDLTYQDLMGPLLGKRFRVQQLLLLRQAFERIHMPTSEDLGRVKEMRAVAR